MPSTLEDIFSSHRKKVIDSQCLKELGLALNQSTEPELNSFFKSTTYNEPHLRLLKLYAARISGQYQILLEGVQAESKLESQCCLESELLFHADSKLLNQDFLLPLLNTVSYSVRTKIIWRIGKYFPKDCVDVADTLFQAIKAEWGISVAVPLICQCSEELIKKQLPLISKLSTTHLRALARRFPFLALAYLEKNSASQKVTHSIVRATLPQSLDYCVTHRYYNALSKTTMRIVLKQYTSIVLDSPAKWSNVLDAKIVHKMLNPESFAQFLSKWFLELENKVMPHTMLSYLELLSPIQTSTLLHKLLPEKYGCPFESNLDYWENNESVLKLLDAKDRNLIAVQLDEQSKGNRWVTLMSCDLSIERIKNDLRYEADAQARASLVEKLMETVKINKDSKALEEVCLFVASRYQNDKNVLQKYFDSMPDDLLTVSNEIWSVVFRLAHKFYNPNDWMTNGASKLFSIALKRDPDMYLKVFMEAYKTNWYHFTDDLFNLKPELRSECINFVFTPDNIISKDYSIRTYLSNFLPVISKWNETSVNPIIYANVNAFVLNLLQSDDQNRYTNENVMNFIRKATNGFDIKLMTSVLQKSSCTEFLRYHISKRLPFTNITEIGDQILEDIFKIGLFKYVGMIERMKKLGYLELLQYLVRKARDVLVNSTKDSRKSRDAIFLISLVAINSDEYFVIIDPLLPPLDSGRETDSNSEGNESSKGDAKPETLEETKIQEHIYKGIGLSFSHLDLPKLAVDRLLRFCVNGNLMLFVRDSLYSVCSSLPNVAAQKVILSLVNKPVSVQKHALRLHRSVCNVQTQLELLKNLLGSEVHLTTRTILIQSAITCLDETRTMETWQVTKEIMMQLTPIDHSIVKWLMTARIPDSFIEEYFKILLEKVKLLKDVTIDIIASTLQVIGNKCSVISDCFVESLLQEYFLSAQFLPYHYHNNVLELFMIYLKGTTLTTDQSNLMCRQQFFAEILNTKAPEPYLNRFDSKLCKYPGRKMFMEFIETFCVNCLCKTNDATNEIDLSVYIDILLAHVNKFDIGTLFQSSVYLSLTQIVMDLSTSIGQRIGTFCDDSLQMHPSLTHYSLPYIMSSYFSIYFASCDKSQILPVFFDLLPPSSVNAEEGMLRLVILGMILPGDWMTERTFEPFKQAFLPLIKNTVVEVMMGNTGNIWTYNKD